MSVVTLVRRWLTRGPYNVVISRSHVAVSDVSNGRKWEGEPVVSILNNEVTGIGLDARLTGDTVVNPFDHPRIFISDFYVAEKLLQMIFATFSPFKWIKPAPIVILQINETLEGGLSQIEKRALSEMAMGAGAYATYLTESKILSDIEIISGYYGDKT